MSPRGLGRGLAALIPGAPSSESVSRAAAPPPSATLAVPPERIHENPFQPRQTFAPDALERLAASIREHGILQPLVVSARADGEYELIAGERRLRAARIAGLTAVPIIVHGNASDDRTKLELALIENIQRQDLNPIECAIAYRRIQEEFGLTQEDIAERVGVARTSVAHALRLLTLPPDMQDAVRSGTVSEGHAKVLVGIADPREQRAWFERIITAHLSVAAVATATREAGARPRGRSTERVPTGDPNLRARALALQQRLGAKVRITADANGGGSIAIAYSDSEELQGILRAILR